MALNFRILRIMIRIRNTDKNLALNLDKIELYKQAEKASCLSPLF